MACQLLPGLRGALVQAALFGCCVAVLLGKYALDHAGRRFADFLLDSSKQLAGAFVVHLLNLALAERLRALDRGDACDWYFVNIVVDCTVGVGIEFLLLRGAAGAAAQLDDDFCTGAYRVGGKVCPRRYWKQLGLWLGVVVCMKLCVLALLEAAAAPLRAASGALLDGLAAGPKLVCVMIATPMAMNSVQFVLTDAFLRLRRAPPSYQLLTDNSP